MDLCKHLRNISGSFSYSHCWNMFRKSFSTTKFECSSHTYFVTTPIFYVNAAPHIGHVQSCLYADALKRVHHLMGKNVIFSTGTDEHGLKVQKAAKSADKEPAEFCKEVSCQFQNVFDKINISYSHFIRTTEQSHIKAVHHFWESLHQKGYIYKGIYNGWYNVSEETFVPSSQIVDITDTSGSKMVCSESGQILERMQEDNYIFSLSKFKDDLLYWLSRDVVKPKIFADRLRHWISDGLEDLSVSRQRSRLTWGIPVPGDSTQTIYVWLDALVNYLTAAGYPDKMKWPADCHVIGKDILKFHGIYWPAFLIAAGLEPPKSIFCHSHWTVNYEKMSKSKGNVVEPLPLMEKYGSDGLRYFLLKAAVPHSDANYSEIKIQRMLNSDLADTFGNLLSRSTAPAINKHQQFPSFDHDTFAKFCSVNGYKLIEEASLLPEAVQQQFLEGNFDKGIDKVMTFLRNANGFMQENKPWELVKLDDTSSQRTLDTVLHIILETLRISGILLQPIIPSMSDKLLSKLGVALEERLWTNIHCFPAYYKSPNVIETKPLGTQKAVLFSRMKN